MTRRSGELFTVRADGIYIQLKEGKGIDCFASIGHTEIFERFVFRRDGVVNSLGGNYEAWLLAP
jgi:hypothetical protein